MNSQTEYLNFENIPRNRHVCITEDVMEAVARSKVKEGLVLVTGMHFSAGVWINDKEDGVLEDINEILDDLLPPELTESEASKYPEDLEDLEGMDDPDDPDDPDSGNVRHKLGVVEPGMIDMLAGNQVLIPISEGQIDIDPWEDLYYAEFGNRRRKRLVVTVFGD